MKRLTLMSLQMTGGIGRKSLSNFYRDHFIFNNPDDTSLELISRTIGIDRVIDEFIFKFTHDRVVDTLLVLFAFTPGFDCYPPSSSLQSTIYSSAFLHKPPTYLYVSTIMKSNLSSPQYTWNPANRTQN
jgi:hypothetical protein